MDYMAKNKTETQLNKYFPYSLYQINYLINCSKKHKFIYVETPKVACSTIKKALQLIEVDGDENKLPKNVHDRKNSPLLSPLNIGVSPEILFESDQYFRFSFVRNPYSRILSAYLDKIVYNEWERKRLLPKLGFKGDRIISFYDFLLAVKEIPNYHKDIHWTPQAYILQRHKIKYDYIGRFENFSNGFKRVLERISPKNAKKLYKIKNNSHKTNANKKIEKYISPKERDLILEIYANDFEVFRYSLDPFFGAV